MTTPTDERELGSTERGFLLYEILLEKPRLVSEIAAELGYASASGASNLLYRMRAAGLVDKYQATREWVAWALQDGGGEADAE